MGLQTKMLAAFLLMGVIVFVVGWIGESGATQLSRHFSEISDVRLPSIMALQTIDYGMRDIQVSELALLNTRLSDAIRQEQLARFALALKEIEAGYNKYNQLPRTQREDKLWGQFISKRERWQQEHDNFMRLYQQFQQSGTFFPAKMQLDLWKAGKEKSAEMEAAERAALLLEQMNVQVFTINRPAFNSAESVLQKLISENEKLVSDAKEKANRSVRQTLFWVSLGMLVGPVTAAILGVVLSLAIAKPLSLAIRGTVSKIVSVSSELAATVEQQERISHNQAISVNQTTATLDELGVSSQQSAGQAEAAAAGARKALTLAQEGTEIVGQTLEGMATVNQKVGAIAEKIVLLSQQTSQIGSISKLVGDLAAQTNMLALNATVEAVRAGSQGKGFGVVAAEIRKLADESRNSAEKISGLVADIQMAINSTVAVTDEGIKTVEAGVRLVRRMASSFAGVSEAIGKVVANNQQISLAVRQQAVAIAQVAQAMNSINTGAQQAVSGISQTKLSTELLSEVARNLGSVV
jgi:hypothetical protein